MSAAEVLLLAAVLAGMSVQSAIGFGFALLVAPAAYAAFPAAEAVTLVILLAIPINLLVLFTERRPRAVEGPTVRAIVLAALPGMAIGAVALDRLDHETLQIALGIVILAGVAAQAAIERPPQLRRSTGTEVATGLAAGALATSVSVNGPVLVLAFTSFGIRGAALRDSLAAALLGLSLPALAIVLVAVGPGEALPPLWILLGSLPAILAGHRFGAAVFRRLDDGVHHRAVLVAAGLAGLLSIVTAVA